MKLGFKDLGITPSCPSCGEKYNTQQDLQIDNYDVSKNKHLHVCDPLKVKQNKQELKAVVKEVNKRQQELLKSKDVDWNSKGMNTPMDI